MLRKDLMPFFPERCAWGNSFYDAERPTVISVCISFSSFYGDVKVYFILLEFRMGVFDSWPSRVVDGYCTGIVYVVVA